MYSGLPAVGKTAFAVTLLKNIGVEQRIPVALFSLELTNAQIVKRLFKNIAFNHESIDCDLFEDMLAIGKEDQYKLLESPIYLDDTASMSIDEIDPIVASFASSKGIKLVIIDYLQLIQSFQVKGDEIMKRLKAIALAHGVCIIALSQLNKNLNPIKSYVSNSVNDLFEKNSKAIINHSDIVLLLCRHKCNNHLGNFTEHQDIAEVIVLKGQSIQNMIVNLYFIPDYVKFTELKSNNYLIR